MSAPQKGYILWLDVVRIVACLLVCIIHSPLPTHGTGSIWISLFNYLSAPCIGLFFMVSGALLFPVTSSLRDWTCKKITRILIPLIVWSIICLCIHASLGQITWDEALLSIIKIPFGPVESVYWFMYTILGLYLFSPFISKAVENTEYVRFFLILWGITLLLPYINAIIPGAWNIGGDYYHLLSNFGGYLGYMILGHYLYKQNYSWEHTCTICCTCLVVAVSIPLCFINNRFNGISNEMLYGYLTINVTALCIIYFLLIKKIATNHCSPRSGGLIREISSKSFGIYLVHILIMRQGIWLLWQTYFPETSYAIQIPLTALLTFVLSYFLIKLLSYLPYSKYIF